MSNVIPVDFVARRRIAVSQIADEMRADSDGAVFAFHHGAAAAAPVVQAYKEDRPSPSVKTSGAWESFRKALGKSVEVASIVVATASAVAVAGGGGLAITDMTELVLHPEMYSTHADHVQLATEVFLGAGATVGGIVAAGLSEKMRILGERIRGVKHDFIRDFDGQQADGLARPLQAVKSAWSSWKERRESAATHETGGIKPA